MNQSRRRFLGTALAGSACAALPVGTAVAAPNEKHHSHDLQERYDQLDAIWKRPVFKRDLFPDPVIIDSIELLQRGDTYMCRVRSRDGVEGVSVSHYTMRILYPIFQQQVRPVFLGQDARRLDDLIEKTLIYMLNYRMGGLGIGIPLATMEFAVLDMMGRIAGVPVGELIGEIHNPYIGVYQATEWRELPVEESVSLIHESVKSSGAPAVKIKVGALMWMKKGLDAKGPAGRTEAIIPRIREVFGPDMTLYADANGYYESIDEAVRVGRLLERYDYGYFEEPLFFDWMDGTKAVADALKIPIAGGEQQHNHFEFRWLLANDGLDIVQPDTYYFGGMIRTHKIALMANALGKPCIPHLSGGFGYIYMLHVVSTMPNAGEHIEFKGYESIPIECPTSSLRLKNGKIKVPSGPGMGVTIDPDFIEGSELLVD